MSEVKTLKPSDGQLPTLIEGQKWKLWLSGALLAVAGIGFVLPSRLGGATAELGALFLTFLSLGWAIYAVRCPHCRLRLVMHAMSNQSIGQWLQWLLTEKRCPRCGADHAGRLPPEPQAIKVKS